MKYLRATLLIILLITAYTASFSQSPKTPVYVIVHGAWGGSWAFKKVDSMLTSKGALVYRPSLTGQGERVHLANSNIGLSTHINDVVNMILYEDLHNVILVGHSYGGMVVTGVADSLSNRIAQLIYLDAFLPEDGESVVLITSKRTNGLSGDGLMKMASNGFLIPSWVPANKLPPKDVPHSVKTFTDTIILKNKQRLAIPSNYILTVEKGKNPNEDDFSLQAERARKKSWPVFILESDHNPQWSAPDALVKLLFQIGK